MWENTTPSTELPRDFSAGIGPLQLGVVLVNIIDSLLPPHSTQTISLLIHFTHKHKTDVCKREMFINIQNKWKMAVNEWKVSNAGKIRAQLWNMCTVSRAVWVIVRKNQSHCQNQAEFLWVAVHKPIRAHTESLAATMSFPRPCIPPGRQDEPLSWNHLVANKETKNKILHRLTRDYPNPTVMFV